MSSVSSSEEEGCGNAELVAHGLAGGMPHSTGHQNELKDDDMSHSEKSTDRQYIFSPYERFRRHVRRNGTKAVVSGVSVAGITAGFLSAAGIVWPLLAYVGIIVFVDGLALALFALPASWARARL